MVCKGFPISRTNSIVYIPYGWTGGLVGISYDLSYTGGGGGTSQVVNNNLFNISGCNTLFSSGRVTAAQLAYRIQKDLVQDIVDNPGSHTSAEVIAAQRWLNTYSLNASWAYEFPDGSTGYYRIGANDTLSEIICDPGT